MKNLYQKNEIFRLLNDLPPTAVLFFNSPVNLSSLQKKIVEFELLKTSSMNLIFNIVLYINSTTTKNTVSLINLITFNKS